MKSKLLKHHKDQVIEYRRRLTSWQDAPPRDDEKCRLEHIKTISGILDFHKRAVKWLSL